MGCARLNSSRLNASSVSPLQPYQGFSSFAYLVSIMSQIVDITFTTAVSCVSNSCRNHDELEGSKTYPWLLHTALKHKSIIASLKRCKIPPPVSFTTNISSSSRETPPHLQPHYGTLIAYMKVQEEQMILSSCVTAIFLSESPALALF